MEENVPNSCPGPNNDNAGRSSTCQGCPNQKLCAAGIKNQVDPATHEIKNKLKGIRHKIAVMSCKGGVGKTSLAVHLARSIARDPSVNVGLLDTDITGPSLPVMMDLQGQQIHQSSSGWIPVYVDDNLAVMSVSFLLESPDTAVVWRGPKKNELIKKFLLDVDWAETEYLIVDTPPGTTDEHFALQEYLNKTVELDGAVLVTTPHESSQDGLRKIINLCGKFKIPIIGVVENMAMFCCPKCEENSALLGPPGITEEICAELSVAFLGSIPLEECIATVCEEGKSFYDLPETSPAAQEMDKIFTSIKNKVSRMKSGEEDNEVPPGQNDSSSRPSSNTENKKDSPEEDASITVCNEPTSIKNVVMVMSGKGGVGKTTSSVQVALALSRKGFKVGLLDADVCGPSVATVLRIKGRNVYNSEQGWLPVYCGSEKRLAVMSTGFFMNDKNDAFIWRGPKKTGMINQFLRDVCWGALDYLVVDTPPGTSDEHLACLNAFREYNVLGAILVTSPQGVSLADVRREVTYCRLTGTKVIGVLENLSGFTCPKCSEVTNIFSKGGGKRLADHFKVPFLGCIPICSSPDAPIKEFADLVDIYLI